MRSVVTTAIHNCVAGKLRPLRKEKVFMCFSYQIMPRFLIFVSPILLVARFNLYAYVLKKLVTS